MPYSSHLLVKKNNFDEMMAWLGVHINGQGVPPSILTPKCMVRAPGVRIRDSIFI